MAMAEPAFPATAHAYPLRVQWEDTDAAGIVYYANYLRFIERGRSDLLLAHGISQDSLMREQGVAFAVRACRIEYLRPARLHEDLTVTTEVAEARGASLLMRQGVWRAADRAALAEAEVRIACIDGAGRPRRIPPAVAEVLSGPFATLLPNSSQSSGSLEKKDRVNG